MSATHPGGNHDRPPPSMRCLQNAGGGIHTVPLLQSAVLPLRERLPYIRYVCPQTGLVLNQTRRKEDGTFLFPPDKTFITQHISPFPFGF